MRAATTSEKKAGKPAESRCRLRLSIVGAMYRVRPIAPEGFGLLRALNIARPGPEPYAIAKSADDRASVRRHAPLPRPWPTPAGPVAMPAIVG